MRDLKTIIKVNFVQKAYIISFSLINLEQKNQNYELNYSNFL